MIDAAKRCLLKQQNPDGHWCGELEGDTILESEYVLLLYFLGRGTDPQTSKCCQRIRGQQLKSGGWSIYPGGGTDVSASVKAYLCLKLDGDDPEAAHMLAARRAICCAGGLQACNSFTKLYLSIFGLWSWRRAPSVPPEIVLLPRWFYFNLYEMSSWSRAILVPLSVIWALKPSAPLAVGLDELHTSVLPSRRRLTAFERGWSVVFRAVDLLIKSVEDVGPVAPWRRRALKAAERWLAARIGESGGLGAIFPAVVNAVIALRCLGYDEDHPLVASQLRELERFGIEEEGELRIQPCFPPVWDTALSANALLAAGEDAYSDPMQDSLCWLLDREVTVAGDWQHKSLQTAPGGWFFEYRNESYPDCDDTSEILFLLARLHGRDAETEARRRAAAARGLRWLLGLQNPDGGWAAFDRRCDKKVLTLIPFADHNAMIDPSTSDITARAIVALLAHGHPVSNPPLRRATAFLLREQEADSCWYGRWGANYIYGTWLALSALRRIADGLEADLVGAGADGSKNGASRLMSQRFVNRLAGAIQRGRDWLLSVQNGDGGWGESLNSYDDPRTRGQGSSTASQTAWAMLGVMAASEPQLAGGGAGRVPRALERGVSFLSERQRQDGSWYDREWTGTGFPRVFYLRYHLYAQYFPLEALAAYRRLGLADWSGPVN